MQDPLTPLTIYYTAPYRGPREARRARLTNGFSSCWSDGLTFHRWSVDFTDEMLTGCLFPARSAGVRAGGGPGAEAWRPLARRVARAAAADPRVVEALAPRHGGKPLPPYRPDAHLSPTHTNRTHISPPLRTDQTHTSPRPPWWCARDIKGLQGPVEATRVLRAQGPCGPACCTGERDETCPISTEGWTRRVHFVREGRDEGYGAVFLEHAGPACCGASGDAR